jgi:hypothetical protein
MNFKAASDRLTDCVRLAAIADETGMSDATIRRARLDPESPAYRSPPSGWEAAIARLARKRAAELVKLADQLES